MHAGEFVLLHEVVSPLSRRLVLIPAALAALLALWPSMARMQPAPAARSSSPPPGRLAGTWRIEQSHEEARSVVNDAIEQAVNAMSFFVRGIARSKLREGTPIHTRIDLEVLDDDRVTVRFDGREGYTTRLGETETRTNPSGMRMQVRQRLRPNGQLEQSFETERGTRWYIYTPLRDGRLRVATTTDSPHMPQPMSFLLDYHRD